MRQWIHLVLAALAITVQGGADAHAATPTATSFAGNRTVGPVFRSGTGTAHGCTASVIASRHHDLMLTAAHCVFGRGTGWQIAPGYHDGKRPYGLWTVAAAYVPPQWMRSQDAQHDYAVLRMQPQRHGGHREAIQDVTGANRVALAPRLGEQITDVAYNSGINDKPIRCTVPAYYTRHYPSFDCHGFVGGSSGSPWLHDGTVVGVIGGLHQGGCTERTSYSSNFRSDVYDLVHRAERGGAGDRAPRPGSDGC
ncbi:MAG TPA: trypsin-like peptidase domain-containing protein [Jatrophihabitans sp.]|jgi:V8-like Glu-specific endopeptidase